jgi:MoCo/4Fe-4S cofactor protein with predicted Tat translocation signal
MSQNKYWQGFGQVNDPENFQKNVEDEFREELPFEGFDDKGLADAKAPRNTWASAPPPPPWLPAVKFP